jgi:hypothetical protein
LLAGLLPRPEDHRRQDPSTSQKLKELMVNTVLGGLGITSWGQRDRGHHGRRLTGWGDGAWGGEALGRTAISSSGGRHSKRRPFDELRLQTPGSATCHEKELPGGLDVALWDLMGKALGVVWRLFGKQHRKRVSPMPGGYRKNWPDRRLAEERGTPRTVVFARQR